MRAINGSNATLTTVESSLVVIAQSELRRAAVTGDELVVSMSNKSEAYGSSATETKG